MKEKVLEALRAAMPEAVSGEELAHSLGVSRTMIWKHIHTLREEGYDIVAVTKRGYILRAVPDKLCPAEIKAYLKTKWLGSSIQYAQEVHSTNEVAKTLAKAGYGHGLVCVAESQTGGKGRLSRGWFSPDGCGVWFSVVLQPTFLPEEASKCTLLAAVAVVEAVNSYPGIKATIKWPNDILLEGCKLVGILTEMSAEFGHINYIVIGAGVNVRIPQELIPEDIRGTAISLDDVSTVPICRAELLARILANIEKYYEMVEANGFSPVLSVWRQYSATIGQRVKVIAPDATYEGVARDIDDEGLLIVEKDDGTVTKVLAGDVSIRPSRPQRSKYQ